MSYQIQNFDTLIDTYIKFGANALIDSIEVENYANKDLLRSTTLQRAKRMTSQSNKEEVILDDLKMELCDQIPHIDRPGFQISQVAELIPRLLFSGHEIKLETSRSIKDEISYSSVYLSSAGEYAYIVGLLMYEDLSLYQEAYQNMILLKRTEARADFKEKTEI